MVYLKWVALLLPSLIMAIVGRLLAPILPFFANDQARLPAWLDWFNTPHTDLDGDQRHWQRNPGTDCWSTYKRRVAWLLRNVAYGFDRQILGFHYDDTYTRKVIGNEAVGDLSGVSGLCRWYAYNGDGKLKAFQIYWVYHYQLGSLKKCIRFGIGWKIWGAFPDHRDNPMVSQYWAYFNPFKSSGL